MLRFLTIMIATLMLLGGARAEADTSELHRDVRAAADILFAIRGGNVVTPLYGVSWEGDRLILKQGNWSLSVAEAPDKRCVFGLFQGSSGRPNTVVNFNNLSSYYQEGYGWIQFLGTRNGPAMILGDRGLSFHYLKVYGDHSLTILQAVQFIQAHRCPPADVSPY